MPALGLAPRQGPHNAVPAGQAPDHSTHRYLGGYADRWRNQHTPRAARGPSHRCAHGDNFNPVPPMMELYTPGLQAVLAKVQPPALVSLGRNAMTDRDIEVAKGLLLALNARVLVVDQDALRRP